MAARKPLPTPPFVSHCLELLAALSRDAGGVRARRLFGGFGIYADDIMVALIADERLYLKTDADTQPAFAAAGCGPFVFRARGREMATSYWSAPPDALDSAAAMVPWAQLAMRAALQAALRAVRARTAIKPSTPPRPGAGAATAASRKPAKRPA